MPEMRAKMRINHIDRRYDGFETLHANPVAASKYPDDGSDEDNTYAKFSPSGVLQLTVANPALLGKFKEGDVFYVDFTKVG